jgi:hypothetical protein
MRQTNFAILKSRRSGSSYMNRMILFDYQKKVLKINRILKLYNILQKIKDENLSK